MKYWTEKESNPVEGMQFWQGTTITKLAENEIFVMGTNPSGIHGAGAAKAGLKFGAKMTAGRGLMGSTYGLITKNLEGKAGFVEKATGIIYDKEGYRSVSTEQIRANIDEMYDLAKQPEHQNKKFLVTYQYESWPNGSPKKSLNGYTSQEILEMFAKDKDVPPNIVFHESYKPHLEKLYKNQNKQSTGELVVFEDGKTIDIKEEDIVWTIDTDESNPQGINGAGAAKAAMSLSKGAKHGIGRGFNGSNAYALVTKSLNAGFLEKSTGILYDKEGYCSVSPEQIRTNIDELYEIAKSLEHKNKKFLISYQYESWPNRTPKKSLNGYTSQEMLEMLVKDKDVPPNIVFHESYKPHLEKLLNNQIRVLNVLPNLLVISPREKAPEDFIVINTTSKDDQNIGKQFSPFFLSNISIYDGIVAKNMENAWQFSKVYNEFVDEDNNPTQAYFDWAKKGWNDSFAHRYANGKGNIPLYSYWKTKDKNSGKVIEHKWDYITARKNIYFPLYAKAIVNTQAFKDLQKRVLSGEKIALWDFDGYNHAARNMTYEDVVNEPKYKCGHAFVLYGLLTKQLKIINNELIYDFNLTLKDDNKMNNIIENTAKEYTFFFHLTSPFSNFHPARFEYRGLTFISNEQFMMYSKAKTFKDEETAKKIINVFNEFQIEPGVFKDVHAKLCFQLIGSFQRGEISRKDILADKDASNAWNTIHKKIKQLGREVKNYDDNVWKERRAKVVLFGAREKFTQNSDLKDILVATGNNIMVEASPYDKLSTMQYVIQKLKEEFSLENKRDNKLKP